MNVKIINDRYSLALATEIRSINTNADRLKENLFKLGQGIGKQIVEENLTTNSNVITPMKKEFQGFAFSNSLSLIYSTKDDYEYFAKGIQNAIPNTKQGYLDFKGIRGSAALTQPIRAVSHPTVSKGTSINTVIIAKAVLATGCTAISIAKNIISKYYPKEIIIASAFYSEVGIQELKSEIPIIKTIYTVGNPDTLNLDGMLEPGVGNLDQRLSM